LTPVAIAEAMALTRTIYGNSPVETDYTNIPTCVFSQPDIACVGLTEQQARAQFKNIAIYLTRFRPLKHTLTGKNEKVLIKLVVNRDDDRVLGAHMLGMDAGEIIQGIAIAIKAGATKSQFDNTVGIHPTAAEEFVTLRKPVAEAP
jgi:glutathione reductase (NADPH)